MDPPRDNLQGGSGKLFLRPAEDDERAFCESLHRRNMVGYLARRGIAWDADRFLASWRAFENLVIMAGPQRVGLLRLAVEPDALGLRDLQLLPEDRHKGVGAWAVRQAQSIAACRGFARLRLRVYEENPAQALYARLGFVAEAVVGGTVHMSWAVPPGGPTAPHRSSGPA